MRKILFYLALVLACSIYGLQQIQYPMPSWINNYVNDLLTLPLVLSICLVAARRIKKEQQLQLPLPLILGITLFYCIYFEWYLPQHNSRYTGDWVDCCLYLVGALFFYILHKKTQKI